MKPSEFVKKYSLERTSIFTLKHSEQSIEDILNRFNDESNENVELSMLEELFKDSDKIKFRDSPEGVKVIKRLFKEKKITYERCKALLILNHLGCIKEIELRSEPLVITLRPIIIK